MNLPAPVGVAIVALFLGVNGVWIAGRLFWPRRQPVFWLASALIVIADGYLIATGVAESIARSLWPIPFDPVKVKEFEKSLCQDHKKYVGFLLAMMPIVLVLAGVILWFRLWQRPLMLALANFLGVICVLVVLFSSLPEKLAILVLPDDALKVPDRCRQTKQ